MYGMRQQQYAQRGYPQGQFQQGQWGPGANMAGYGAMGQQQGAMPGYQATPAFQGQAYGQQPAAAATNGTQAGFSQQQQQQWPQQQYGQQQAWGQHQQQMGWTQEQWNAQQSNWANGAAPSPRPAQATAANPNMYPMAGQQEVAKRPDPSKATTGEGMQPETYQRTLEYVQQCQSWSSPPTGDYGSVMSPDSSSVKGAKPKGSPGTDSQAMPPPSQPPPMGEPRKPSQIEEGNMVIADMSSSLNTLMEENRYLHMMQ